MHPFVCLLLSASWLLAPSPLFAAASPEQLQELEKDQLAAKDFGPAGRYGGAHLLARPARHLTKSQCWRGLRSRTPPIRAHITRPRLLRAGGLPARFISRRKAARRGDPDQP